MRKLIFIGIVAIGALAGLLSAANDNWATRVVMAAVGVLFAAPIGAVLTRKRKVDFDEIDWDESAEVAGTTSPKALVANYWRDKGHAPFMMPPEVDAGKHMFDPDKLG